MSVPFSAITTPNSIAFTDLSGKTINVDSSHTEFAALKALVADIKAAIRDGLADLERELRERLSDIASPAKAIILHGKGLVIVVGGHVLYKGVPIHNAITERILWGISEGADMSSYITFLENLMQNPSKRSVDQLYTFLEKHRMGITEDGQILAYKRVRDNFHDIHSGKFDNSPGKIVEMERNQVNDDPDQTCSSGLHACSMDYLPSFGTGGGNRIVIVKINPRDVVSIPKDYNASKMRVCRYEVIAEYTGSDKDDLLKTKPIWNEQSFLPASDWDTDDDIDDHEDDYEDDSSHPDNWPDEQIDTVTYIVNSDDRPEGAEVLYSSGEIIEVEEEYLDDLEDAIRDNWTKPRVRTRRR